MTYAEWNARADRVAEGLACDDRGPSDWVTHDIGFLLSVG
jgi:hypothetical protein